MTTYEKRKEYFKQKIECECGATITRAAKSLHIKSEKHHKMLEKNNKKLMNQDFIEFLEKQIEIYKNTSEEK